MNKPLRLLAVLLACFAWWCGAPPLARAAVPVSYRPNFISNGAEVPVQFRAWVPETTERIKGVFVTLPGTNGSQEGITGNSLWQFRLSNMGWAIVGFRDAPGGNYEYWGVNPQEAHANFQSVLDMVADSFGHPEIANAPVVLDGISQGGYIVGQLASLIPDRTLGFIADKGYANNGFPSAGYQAPGLAIVGGRDDRVPPFVVDTYFQFARSAGVDMGLLVEWHRSHMETSENLRLTALNQFTRARYPVGELPSLEPGHPLQLVEPEGWLINAPTIDGAFNPVFDPDLYAAPASSFPGDPALASWVPTETMARVYAAQHNNTFYPTRVQMTPTPVNRTVATINLAVTGIPWTKLDVYHEEELLATLYPGDLLRVSYTARQNGLHTFVAVAEYDDAGVTRLAGNYLTVDVFDAVPEPAAILLALPGVCFLVRRTLRGRAATDGAQAEHSLQTARCGERSGGAAAVSEAPSARPT